MSPQPEAPALFEPRRGLLFLAGGSLVVPAVAFLLGLIALPEHETSSEFAGPWMTPLGATYELVFEAWDARYPEVRLKEADVAARLREVVAAHTRAAEAADPSYDPDFRRELAAAIEPIVFPVHVGRGRRPLDRDPSSGLGPGASRATSTLREPFGRVLVHVDARARTVLVDGGPPRSYVGDERDLIVTTADGRTLHLDVSGIRSGFQGDVPVGVKGRLVRLLRRERD